MKRTPLMIFSEYINYIHQNTISDVKISNGRILIRCNLKYSHERAIREYCLKNKIIRLYGSVHGKKNRKYYILTDYGLIIYQKIRLNPELIKIDSIKFSK